MAKRGKLVTAWILIVLGLIVTFGTHIGLLIIGLEQSMVAAHAWLNLGASVLILIGILLMRSKN